VLYVRVKYVYMYASLRQSYQITKNMIGRGDEELLSLTQYILIFRQGCLVFIQIAYLMAKAKLIFQFILVSVYLVNRTLILLCDCPTFNLHGGSHFSTGQAEISRKDHPFLDPLSITDCQPIGSINTSL